MATDHIRYDLLAQDALRGLVRKVLTDTAKSGLPGEHHFSISFRTDAEGVKLSPRLREQFPQEMTVILQYQFWDLKVTDTGLRGRAVVRRRAGKAHGAVRRDQELLRSRGAVRAAIRDHRGRAAGVRDAPAATASRRILAGRKRRRRQATPSPPKKQSRKPRRLRPAFGRSRASRPLPEEIALRSIPASMRLWSARCARRYIRRMAMTAE